MRLMADDMAALIDHLGLDRPDIVGYSLGGGVAFWTASKYPDKVRRLVMASANIRRDAIPPEMLAQQDQVSSAAVTFLKDTPMYELYQRVAPRPEDFGQLLDKIGASMAQDFDFSDEVRALQVPTLIVAADADMAPPSHYVEVFKLLDGGLRDGGWMGEGRPKGGHALAILPRLTHYNLGASPLFATVTLDFPGRLGGLEAFRRGFGRGGRRLLGRRQGCEQDAAAVLTGFEIGIEQLRCQGIGKAAQQRMVHLTDQLGMADGECVRNGQFVITRV